MSNLTILGSYNLAKPECWDVGFHFHDCGIDGPRRGSIPRLGLVVNR